MNIWIDIDKAEHIPFLKALINELNQRGHKVTLTALDTKEIKERLKEHNLDAHVTGKIFSFFGFIPEQVYLMRAGMLSNHISDKKIDISFSFGSESMVYTCMNLNLQTILFLQNYRQNINWMYFKLENSYFMLPEFIPEQKLLGQGINPRRIVKLKGYIQEDTLSTNTKIIKEIVNQIQDLSGYRDLKA